MFTGPGTLHLLVRWSRGAGEPPIPTLPELSSVSPSPLPLPSILLGGGRGVASAPSLPVCALFLASSPGVWWVGSDLLGPRACGRALSPGRSAGRRSPAPGNAPPPGSATARPGYLVST